MLNKILQLKCAYIGKKYFYHDLKLEKPSISCYNIAGS